MRESEFFYWLQGYFELGSPTALTIEQVECIRRHVHLVRLSAPTEAMTSVIVILVLMSEGDMDLQRGTDKLRARVAAHFQHVLDHQAPGAATQAELNHTHDPTGKTVYRC